MRRALLLALLAFGLSIPGLAKAAPQDELLSSLFIPSRPGKVMPQLPPFQDELVSFNYLDCTFYKNGHEGDGFRSESEEIDVVFHFERISPKWQKARVISTRMAGARNVTVFKTEKGVHFLDHLAGSVIMTTVFACEARVSRGGKHPCNRFTAVNSWHIDSSSYYDPDNAFVRLKTSSNYGFCEPWFVD